MQFELGLTRDGLKEVKSRMAQAAPTHFSPKELLRQYSDTIDGIVRKAFQKAQLIVSSSSVCLVAVGGYGRSELAPYSDVDLLLLYSTPQKLDLPLLIEKTLYPLWDLGLDVSCSSRSISDCLKLAQSDPYVKTGLIDSRYLDGEYEFFRSLYEITQALTDHGCDIHFARISTLGNRIVDVFYIQDEWGEKIAEKDRIERLKQTLLNRLTSGGLSG